MDTASKNVQFVLETVVDQDARATVLSFATELKRAQESLKGFTDSTVASLANANREIAQTLHSLTETRTTIAVAGADRLAKVEENLSAIIRERSKRTTDEVIDDIDARVKAEEEANRRVRNMPAPVPGNTPGENSPSGDHADQERRAKAYEDANLRIVRSEGTTAASIQRAAGMTEDAYQSMQGQLRNMRREMFATAAEASGSLMQVARGFMALGLVSEKDLEKVARGLVGIQAMFDVVSGGTRVLLSLEKVMHLYRASTQMATVAQEGFNGALLRTQVLSNAGLLGGIGTAAAGMAGKVKALFTAKAAGDAAAAAAVAAAVAAAGREAAYLGTSAAAGAAAPAASRAAGGFMAGTLMGRAVPAMGMGGIALAAAGATAFAGYGAYDAANQARTAGIGGGANPKSYTDWMGGGRYNPMNWAVNAGYSAAGYGNANKDADKSAEKTTKLEKRAAAFKELREADYDRLAVAGEKLQVAMMSARESSAGIFSNSLETMKNDAKREAIISRLAATEKESAQLKVQTANIDERFAADKLAHQNALRASRLEEIDLLNRQVSIERDIADAKKRAAETRLAAESETLSKMESQLQVSKDQLLSARERFAMMNESDQKSITQLAGRLKSGAKLSAEELGKLSSFRELGGVKDAFDSQLDRRAKAGGFDKTFGVDAQAAIDATEQWTKMHRSLVAGLKTEINVTIDADTKKITEELTKKVGEKLKQLGDEIRTSVSKLDAEVRTIEQRMINRANQP